MLTGSSISNPKFCFDENGKSLTLHRINNYHTQSYKVFINLHDLVMIVISKSSINANLGVNTLVHFQSPSAATESNVVYRKGIF